MRCIRCACVRESDICVYIIYIPSSTLVKIEDTPGCFMHLYVTHTHTHHTIHTYRERERERDRTGEGSESLLGATPGVTTGPRLTEFTTPFSKLIHIPAIFSRTLPLRLLT